MNDQKLNVRYDGVKRSVTFNNLLKTYSLGSKKVLDVGCGHGEYLKHFGPGSIGLTVNEDEVESGKKMGVVIKVGNIEQMTEDVGEFDVIYANNIFEHMLAPHTFLITIKKYLRSGGILILGVPCVPYVMPLKYFARFRGFASPSHVNFFVRETLRLTVVAAGWNVKKCSGFYFRLHILDQLFNLVCPHFYVVATPAADFEYDAKRLRELAAYQH